MLEQVQIILSDAIFWGRVGIGIAIWYLLAVGFAQFFFFLKIKPFRAARAGPILGLIVALVIIAFGSWYIWQDPLLTVMLTFTAGLIPSLLLYVLFRAEPVSVD